MENIDEATVVMKAGYCWQPIYECLEKDGYEVKLAHPLETKAIAKAKIFLVLDTIMRFCWLLRLVA